MIFIIKSVNIQELKCNFNESYCNPVSVIGFLLTILALMKIYFSNLRLLKITSLRFSSFGEIISKYFLLRDDKIFSNFAVGPVFIGLNRFYVEEFLV
jgi:hypothetical protein